MREKLPETQVEALVGTMPNCRDIELVIGNITARSYFDAIATVKDTRQKTELHVEWPLHLPQNNQQLIIGTGSVVDAPKAHRQMNDLIERGANPHIRLSSKGYEPRFVIDEDAIVNTPVENWRSDLREAASMTDIEKKRDQESRTKLTFKKALKFTEQDTEEDKDAGRKAFISHIVEEGYRLLQDLEDGKYNVSDETRDKTKNLINQNMDMILQNEADAIFSSLKELKPYVGDSKQVLSDVVSQGLRVFVESSHDVSQDIYTRDRTELQLNKHLGLLGLGSADHLYAVLNFMNSDDSAVNVANLAEVMRMLKPDDMVGTRLYAVPALGEFATVVSGYNYEGEVKSTPPKSLKPTVDPTKLYAFLSTWSEDVRYISSRRGFSQNAESYVRFFENLIGRGDILLADLHTKIDTRKLTVDEIEERIKAPENVALGYRDVPSINDDPEFSLLTARHNPSLMPQTTAENTEPGINTYSPEPENIQPEQENPGNTNDNFSHEDQSGNSNNPDQPY